MTSWISDGELVQMREVLSHTLPDTAVIWGATVTQDATGAPIESYAVVTGGTVSCRLDPLPFRTQLNTVAGAEGFVAQFVLTLPYDAPVAANRRVVIGGDTYEITRLADDHSWRIARKCYVSRIE